MNQANLRIAYNLNATNYLYPTNAINAIQF